jgi:hypothetical protein
VTCNCNRSQVDDLPGEPTEAECAVALFRSVLTLHPNLLVTPLGVMLHEDGIMLGSTALETLITKVGAQA